MMRIDIQSSNHVVTLFCSGRLVYGVEAEMLRTMVQSRPEATIQINLSGVNAIDASGLGLLVELHSWAAATRRTLTLMDLSESVWRMVILTKLCAALDISYSDVPILRADEGLDREEMIA